MVIIRVGMSPITIREMNSQQCADQHDKKYNIYKNEMQVLFEEEKCATLAQKRGAFMYNLTVLINDFWHLYDLPFDIWLVIVQMQEKIAHE